MKPVIGIIGRVEYPGGTGKIAVNESVRRKVVRHGGNPLCILCPQDVDYTNEKYEDQKELTEEEKEMVIKQISLCDGILMPGGFKFLRCERFILDYIVENNIPTLGICLGMQLISNYKKEEIWNEKNPEGFNHSSPDVDYVHYVTLDKNSKLYSIIGKERFMVNSRHNYHALPTEYCEIVAVSDDNIVEAIEIKDKTFQIGVQWHPEDLEDEQANKLFDRFIEEAKKNMVK